MACADDTYPGLDATPLGLCALTDAYRAATVATADVARPNSLRPATIYLGVRQAALRKLVLDNQDQIADLAGRLLSVRLKRDLRLAELEMEAARSEKMKEARAERRRDKLYAEVAAAADHLYEAHGVTYHHWKAAGEEQLAAVAAVL